MTKPDGFTNDSSGPFTNSAQGRAVVEGSDQPLLDGQASVPEAPMPVSGPHSRREPSDAARWGGTGREFPVNIRPS